MTKESITWLPLSLRKNISQVRIVVEPYCPTKLYGGYYVPGTNVLVVVEKPPDVPTNCIAATIAHEYRHHIQFELGMFPTIASYARQDLPYEDQIRWFFNHYPSEMDALLFEHKHYKTELNSWWLKHLVKPNTKK